MDANLTMLYSEHSQQMHSKAMVNSNEVANPCNNGDENSESKRENTVKSVFPVTSIKPCISEEAVASRFSKAASKYNHLANIQKIIAQTAIDNLPRRLTEEALDIGCATGTHTQTLCDMGANTTGVDIAEGMLAHAKATYALPTFVHASALNLPFSDEQFSTVFSSMALQWVSDPRKAASQISRVLKKGGIAELAIMVDGSFGELKRAREIAQLPQANTPMPSSSQWSKAFAQTGLRLSRVIVKDYVDSHSTIMGFLRSVKGVGAGETGQKQPLLMRHDLNKLDKAYRNICGVKDKLPLTYRVGHYRLEKR